MKTTKTLIITIAVLVLIVATAMVLKAGLFSSVKDSYFTPDSDVLRKVPAGIVIVRPTRFPQAYGKIRHVHDGDSLARTVGQNATFRDMMAEAYDCSPGHVVLPADAPDGHFDFLVTVPETRKHLRTAIQKQTGYVAHHEERNTDILVLKVQETSLPGLTVSAADEDSDIIYKDGTLYFKHKQFDTIVEGLENGLKLPILDQTGLTNYYDYSLVWNTNIARHIETGNVDPDGVRRVLAGWGLRLDPDTASQDMIIVEKSR